MKRRTRLKNLNLEELSLVDRPANQGALARLFKRAPDAEPLLRQLLEKMGLSNEDEDEAVDLEKMHAALTASVESILEHSGNAEELQANLTKTLDQYRDALVKAACDPEDMGADEMEEGATGTRVPPGKKKPPVKKADEGAEPITKETTQMSDKLPEAVAKGLTPEAQAYITNLEKKLTETTAAATTALEKHATVERMVLAKQLTGETGAGVDQVATVLKQLDEAGKTAFTAIMAKFAEVHKRSDLFKSTGTDVNDVPESETAAGSELEKYATEFQKADPKLTDEQAIAKALDAHPELYEAYAGV